MANHDLFSQGVDETIGNNLSLGTSTISPNNLDLSLNSSTHLTTPYQTMPSQLSLYHHLGEAGMGRTNLTGSCEARTCNGHPIINVVIVNNNNPPHQSNDNLSVTSSNVGPTRLPLNFRDPFSRYASLSGTANRSETLDTRVPKYHPENSTSGLGQGKPHQNSDDQSNIDLGLRHIISKYFPDYNHQPFPSSTVTGQESHRTSYPSSEDGLVILSNRNTHSRPLQNNITPRPERNIEQAIPLNHGIEPQTRARRHQNLAQRHKSKPYTKYGPYLCPHCEVVFDNAYVFSAHAQTHYKDESPAERMRRREGKTRKRAMCIAQSSSGMTVVPESLQLGNRLMVPFNTNGDKVSEAKQGEGFSYLRVKKEVKEEQMD